MKLYQINNFVIENLQKNNINILLSKKITCFITKINYDSFFDNLNNEYYFNKNKLFKTINKLKKDYPIQYIMKYEYFDNKKIYVNKHVLIPRPETEELCEIIKYQYSQDKYKKLNIVNVGSGSGNIEINLSYFFINSNIIGFEISKKAIRVANKNIKNYKLRNVNVYKANIVNKNILKDSKIDILVSNPPYVNNIEHIDNSVLKYEPSLALLENKKSSYYYKIISQYFSLLKKDSTIFFECEDSNVNDIEIACKNFFENYDICFQKDLNNKIRFAIIKIKE